jgi:predicted PolB exonuclease-like 3'-5' exonuclease
MAEGDTAVRYFVFDVESVADGDLVAAIQYTGKKVSPAQAIERYRGERLEKYDSDFIPYTFQKPVSVAVAKVNAGFELIDLVTLDDPEYRTPVIVENFWRGWLSYGMPTLVSFNGRGFDIPLLELAAFRYGIAVPDWFNLQERSWDQKRNRYNVQAHLDLQDLFTNYGATRLNGGLNLIATLLGLPGKMDIAGHMVQNLYDEGNLAEINAYCRCDVLDTYLVFLRAMVLLGRLELTREQELFARTRHWLEQRVDQQPLYREYLQQWQPWENPWDEQLALET